MCGIAGYTGQRPAGAEVLRLMADDLVHRGPDEGGFFEGDGAAMAIRRLSIIDVATGHQPYSNESGTVTAVFNGEIYGFQALRDELVKRGHRFRTRADGEVIVHAYEEYGVGFVTHLDGMFALAVWDSAERTLVLARDRLGKKPLFYAQLPGGDITFASELHALGRDPLLRRTIDPAAVGQYLRWGFVPAPDTIFREVRKLRPGAVLVLRDGRVDESLYWSLPFEPKMSISYSEALEEFERLAGDAVRARLISDVPLGAFLSGGLDSTYVASRMAEMSDRRVSTFTIGFGDSRYDERVFARRAAAEIGTDHHEAVVSPTDLSSVLPQLVRHFGEPFADSSAIPTYYLARMARENITVALTGDGGDELLAGYERHVAARWSARLDTVPAPLRMGLVGAARLAGSSSGHPKSRRRKLDRLARELGMPLDARFANWASMLTAAECAELAPRAPAAVALPPPGDPRDALDRALAVDVARYLPGDLLVKMDIATMACSLEARSPLLDHRLMEFAARLPSSFKQRGLQRKRLLHDALGQRVSPKIFDRPKMGFAVPIGAWLRAELRELVDDVLLEPRALDRGWFAPDAIRRLVREHREQSADHSRALWSALMLELWQREFVDRGQAPALSSGQALAR